MYFSQVENVGPVDQVFLSKLPLLLVRLNSTGSHSISSQVSIRTVRHNFRLGKEEVTPTEVSAPGKTGLLIERNKAVARFKV